MWAVIDLETTGLNPFTDQIVAIGTWFENFSGPFVMTAENEEAEGDMLEHFWHSMKNVDLLVGFNIDFDWQFLKLRSLKHGIKIKYFSRARDARYRRIDIRRILNPDRYAKGRLKDYAIFLGIEFEDETNGYDVPELFAQGNFDEIAKHCSSDVELTYKIWKRLLECGLVEVGVGESESG